MIATVENMKKVEVDPRVFAWSPSTEERYSADPGDYFLMQPGDALTDRNGDPMILAVEVCEIVEVGEGEQR